MSPALSETFSYSETAPNDANLDVSINNMFGGDHCPNCERGVIHLYIFYNTTQGLKLIWQWVLDNTPLFAPTATNEISS